MMLPMLESDTISILHFDDEKMARTMLKLKLSTEYDIRFFGESTLKNAEMYLGPAWIDNFNVIVCDYCMPDVNAGHKLKLFAECKKNIIFYSCLTEDQFCKNVYSILGYIPFNFRFVQKCDPKQFDKIISFIESDLC